MRIGQRRIMQVQPTSAAPHVTGAIRQAAHSTGANFNYLLATAQIESNLNPGAQASTSSAKGLFQFIDQTLARHRQALGAGVRAGALCRRDRARTGRAARRAPAARDAIMRLRADPRVNAMMAGAYTRNNAAQLTDGLGARRAKASFISRIFSAPTAREN
ncbi:MAG: transglycosylase SLT domain-containing protein [Pseudolabrys sp.]